MTQSAILRLGTRGSPLALAQAHEVKRRLAEAHGDLAAENAIEIVIIKTTGDKILDRALSEIGGKGLFTKEIEEALLDGSIDAAVHSMKDVPTWLPDGLEISTILPREDPRDAFFSLKADRLSGLPEGAVVGSASLRRQAQILLARPDLTVVTFRGNVQTRLRKLAEGEVDATLLAVAGLRRLGEAGRITSILETDEMLPAVAQGAVGLEIRSDDSTTRGYLSAIDDAASAVRVAAERACLEVLDGSCRTPIAALAELDETPGLLKLRALVAMPDGSRVWRGAREGSAGYAAELGKDLGQELRAEMGPEALQSLTSH
ncbi:hydroxymethylbilane synthase [Denitrobaculum tricleocarpae]|uniref:Porphobilinogen deaminase n=1 Tax=Denitrobaculum tricleocarpae TaxID=2591009 RepID=A0A545TR90_9PROT|nr:hydroxymethylbilane synthase [Denitrobaculum tricleocarpae]TQV79733.1 hydroxymethylbilane synthase [Denitrobaculum tricleocarpae]